MRRILFEWHGVRVYSYPALLYLGLVLGLAAQNHAAHVAGLPAGRVFAATLLLLVPALAGARLLFVLQNWRVYRHEPRRVWRRAEGGSAMLGAVPVMLLVSWPVLAALDLPYGAFWDVSTFCILVGMMFTRVGCLLNGCCCGRPSESAWALRLADVRGVCRRRLPTQLLEAGWAALLLAGAAALWPLRPFPGALFLAALAVYAAGRVALQATRERRPVLGPTDLQQLLASALAGLSLAALVLLWP